MSFVKPYILLLLLIGIASCNNTGTDKKVPVKDSGLLSGGLVKNPYTASGTDTAVVSQLATLDFKDTTYDFGTITEGDVVEHEFAFTNGGKSPLIISKATGSCGCTIADFPHEPLPSGKNGKITVSFNSKDKTGPQNKTVSINTNTKRGVHLLFITANVVESKKKK